MRVCRLCAWHVTYEPEVCPNCGSPDLYDPSTDSAPAKPKAVATPMPTPKPKAKAQKHKK